MIREIAIVLFGLTTVFAQFPYPYGYKSAPLVGAVPTHHVVPVPVPAPVHFAAPGPKVFVPAAPHPVPFPVPVATPKVFAPVPVPVHHAPLPVPQVRSGVAEKDAHVVSEAREVNFDGTFNYGFDSENGISVKSKGYIKPAPSANEEPIQVIEGSYSYVDASGKPVTINYVADENGYRAYGDGIPQPSEAILKSLPSSGN